MTIMMTSSVWWLWLELLLISGRWAKCTASLSLAKFECQKEEYANNGKRSNNGTGNPSSVVGCGCCGVRAFLSRI